MKRVAEITRDVVAVAREVKGSCAAGIKEGDRIYFTGAGIDLNRTDRVCAYALCNIMPVVFACRMGVDFDKMGLEGRFWQCVDPGPPYTPGGTVLFEVLPAEKDRKRGKNETDNKCR